MKILYLTNIPSPYRVDFFNELGKMCELTVLFERERASDRDERWESKHSNTFDSIFLKGKKIGADKSFCPGVVKHLNQTYDAIILGGYSSPTYMLAIEYMRLKKIPFLLNADGGFPKEDKAIIHWLKKRCIGAASGWVSTGKATDDYLKHYGAMEQWIYHYPFTSVSGKSFCQPTDTERKRAKAELRIAEDRIAISVGQFIPRKGFDLLINAAGKINQRYGVYIVGGVPDEEYLNMQKRYGASNVHFLDFMDKEELQKYYCAADVFVFPTREDIWGLVLNEAMAFALPSIASNKANAAIELIVDGENGYLVDPEQTNIIADRMEILFKDDGLRKEMSAKAFQSVQNYSIEKMAASHISILEDWKMRRKQINA